MNKIWDEDSGQYEPFVPDVKVFGPEHAECAIANNLLREQLVLRTRERDEARAEVVRLGQSVALTVAQELRSIGHTPGIPEGGWRWILDHANALEAMANSVSDLPIQDGTRG